MTALILAACCLAPLLVMRIMSPVEITRARDWWLRGMLAGATVWLTWAEPIFAPLALWFLCRWRTEREVGPLVAWSAVVVAWMTLRGVARETLDLVPVAWLAWVLVTVALLVYQRFWLGMRPHEGRNPSGTFGQRTFAAAYLALCLPFAPWGLWPAIGLGLWLTGPSWGALAALAVGLPVLGGALGAALALSMALGASLGVLVGWTIPLAFTAVRVLLIDRTPRGSSLDSLLSRYHALRLMWRHRGEALPWGAGPGTTWKILLRLEAAYQVKLPRGDCHNDAVQLLWEYGLLGAAMIGIAAYRIGSGLTWGDPWSAAAVIGGVLSLTSLALRVPAVGLTCLVIFGRVAP